MNLIDYAISHARVFFGILIFIIVAGSSTYISIPKEAVPDVNIPIIYVRFLKMPIRMFWYTFSTHLKTNKLEIFLYSIF